MENKLCFICKTEPRYSKISYCKACHDAEKEKRALANPAHARRMQRIYMRRYVNKDRAAYSDYQKNYQKTYVEKHSETLKAKRKAKYEANKTEILAKKAEYARKNRAKINKRRKALRDERKQNKA